MIEVASVSRERYQELAQFLATADAGGKTPAYWARCFRFWWDENPVTDAERGWVLLAENRVVGFLGVIPIAFQIAGKPAIAYSATTWHVDKAYRVHGMKLLLRAIAASKNAILFNTTPNDRVIPILEQMKFRKYPTASNNTGRRPTGLYILNAQKVMALRKGSGVAMRVAQAAAPLLKWTQDRYIHFRQGGRVAGRVMACADSSLDALWARTCGQSENTAVRSARALNWFCSGGVAGTRKLIGAFAADERAVGVATFRALEDRGVRLLECVDLWCDLQAPEAQVALVACAASHARDTGADAVLFPHFSSCVGRGFRRMGLFDLRLGPHRGPYFWARADLAHSIREENSYFTDMQGDTAVF